MKIILFIKIFRLVINKINLVKKIIKKIINIFIKKLKNILEMKKEFFEK